MKFMLSKGNYDRNTDTITDGFEIEIDAKELKASDIAWEFCDEDVKMRDIMVIDFGDSEGKIIWRKKNQLKAIIFKEI